MVNRRGHSGFACIWNIVKNSFCFISPQACHVPAIKSWNIKACSDATWTEPLWRHRLIRTHRPVKYKLLVSGQNENRGSKNIVMSRSNILTWVPSA